MFSRIRTSGRHTQRAFFLSNEDYTMHLATATVYMFTAMPSVKVDCAVTLGSLKPVQLSLYIEFWVGTRRTDGRIGDEELVCYS